MPARWGRRRGLPTIRLGGATGSWTDRTDRTDWTDPALRPGQSNPSDPSNPTHPSNSEARPLPPLPPPSIARPSYPPLVPSNVPLSGRGRGPTAFRLLGQYKGSLVLLEGHDGFYLVDQHAAHERILYERLRRSFAARAPQSQILLEPLLLELAPAEVMRLEELAGALAACGFEVMPLSGGTVAIRAVPDQLELEQATDLVQRLATSDGEAADEAGSGGPPHPRGAGRRAVVQGGDQDPPGDGRRRDGGFGQ